MCALLETASHFCEVVVLKSRISLQKIGTTDLLVQITNLASFKTSNCQHFAGLLCLTLGQVRPLSHLSILAKQFGALVLISASKLTNLYRMST